MAHMVLEKRGLELRCCSSMEGLKIMDRLRTKMRPSCVARISLQAKDEEGFHRAKSARWGGGSHCAGRQASSREKRGMAQRGKSKREGRGVSLLRLIS